MSKKQRSRFVTHLLGVGAYVSGFFWLAFVYAAWVLVSTPETGKHSHLVGWVTLIVAVVVMIVTIDHWVNYLQVIFGGFFLGCLLAAGTGHLLNGGPFPRPIAFALMILLVGCNIIARTLARRALRVFDRVALIGFLTASVVGLFNGSPTWGLLGLGIGFACLFAAWTHNRLSPVPRRSDELTH